MKNLKNILFIALLFFLSSCATTVKFPTSSITPAADISVKKKADKNGNFKVSITAKNLAAAERLDPPKSAYIVWIITESDGIRSIGRLVNKNAQTATIETLTPFAFNEIFITAEGKEDVSYPSGVEIARVKFRK
jgi:PBP1b-binding outer membrane lipoprotein LpoB